MPADLRGTARDATRSILGHSPAMCLLRSEIRALARHATTVLITGPSGTGKELIARAIHSVSDRSPRSFVPVDCTSITGNLFASQLFGHRRGAFTGADYEALGCFRAAHRGTIFLDEIGDLEPDMQSKLLRVLEERTVVPLGAYEAIPVDVRVIAATNRNLKWAVAAGDFRADLYFRLAVATLETEPLRSRTEDIPQLAQHFLGRMSTDYGLPSKTLSPAAMGVFQDFEWPGNVRQLRHVLEQAAIICDSAVIGGRWAQHLIDKARLPLPEPHGDAAPAGPVDDSRWAPPDIGTSAPTFAPHRWPTLQALERDYIVRVLQRTDYNRSAAARLLGITRQALIRRIKKHGIATRRSQPR